ncbi:MAG: gamma-glutamylcyclotransferase [Rhodospirillaceae bacterium]|nr:gamma-glutamylcyclotransferase [Rhodospirillales bacterium]
MTTTDDLWVFGYGSLMWRPGFEFAEVRPALLAGWYRAFCLYSMHYRGTPARPGLVLGLDDGESCRGLAFRVPSAEAEMAVEYLNERELIGYAYEPRTLPITLDDGRVVPAYTFVADRGHRHYAGNLPLEEAAAIIMDAQGCAGLNRDYLINTVRKLEAEGFADQSLHALLVEVERQTGLIDRGAGI